ncbi:hypothetical protein RV134_290091 [Roseovarius sp. EC-HK134]|nr:hypothetical protein RV134_290091 [Roseovarius sp. EC-HK134]VVT18353.1 hypothetical protein RV420_360086 [Roseovarius sp. EC-SD190]
MRGDDCLECGAMHVCLLSDVLLDKRGTEGIIPLTRKFRAAPGAEPVLNSGRAASSVQSTADFFDRLEPR